MEEVQLGGNVSTRSSTPAPSAENAESLSKQFSSFRQAFFNLSQLERRCSESVYQIENGTSQVRRELEQLRAELARLQVNGIEGVGGSPPGGLKRTHSGRLAPRGTWVNPDESPRSAPEGRGSQRGSQRGSVLLLDDDDDESTGSKDIRMLPSRFSMVSSTGTGSRTMSVTRPMALRTITSEGGTNNGQSWRPPPPPAGRGKLRSAEEFFPDVDRMKASMLQAVVMPSYDVRDYYTTGRISAFVKSRVYEACVLGVIVLSVIWLAVEAEHNAGQELFSSPILFQVVEHALSFFFLVDLFLRFAAFDRKRQCLRDSWFVVDLVLVSIMVIETWILPVVFMALNVDAAQVSGMSIVRFLRILRLARMVRLVRLFRFLPGFTSLARGAVASARALLLTLSMLMAAIYAFAVLFAHTTVDMRIGRAHFGSMVESLATVMLRGTVPDFADMVYEIGQESRLLAALFLVFVLLAFLSVLQLMTGLSVHVVGSLAAVEKERLTAEFVRSRLLAVMRHAGRGLMGTLAKGSPMPMSQRDFEELMREPKAARALQEMGVDPDALYETAKNASMPDGRCGFFGSDGQQLLSFPEFLGVVLSHRGSNTATVQDVVESRRTFAAQLRHQGGKIAREVKASISTLQLQLADIAAVVSDGGSKDAAWSLRASAAGGSPTPANSATRSRSTGRSRSSRAATWQGTPASGIVQGQIGNRETTPRQGRGSSTQPGSERGVGGSPGPQPNSRRSITSTTDEGPFSRSSVI